MRLSSKGVLQMAGQFRIVFKRNQLFSLSGKRKRQTPIAWADFDDPILGSKLGGREHALNNSPVG
jgi:hypothetical protein